MFKKSYLLSMLLIAMLVLAACGTSDQEKGSTSNDSNGQDTTEDVENNETENDENNSSEEDDIEQETDAGTEDEDEEDSNAGEKNNENDANNNGEEQFQANAEQVDSEAQDFAIQILPAYTLTSEEPGRDSLYLTEDGNTFMRIETMPFDQEAYDYFDESTTSLFEATKADGETVDEVTDSNMLPQGVNDVVGYTVQANENTLTAFVFEKDGLLVRLTIFDTLAQEHFNDFLQMGETITKK